MSLTELTHHSILVNQSVPPAMSMVVRLDMVELLAPELTGFDYAVCNPGMRVAAVVVRPLQLWFGEYYSREVAKVGVVRPCFTDANTGLARHWVLRHSLLAN
jgi:hypothetical protein